MVRDSVGHARPVAGQRKVTRCRNHHGKDSADDPGESPTSAQGKADRAQYDQNERR